MQYHSYRRLPVLLLVGCALALPVLAHADTGQATLDGVGNVVAYSTCAGGLAVATTPAAVFAALAYCLHLLVKTIPA